MWMMGYNDGDFNTRELRPLIPKPISSSTNNVLSPTLHGTDFFSLNNRMDQSKRELNTQPGVIVSSRWNPTPEQLRTLEELYRRGTRTPSADQIQHITAQLRRYGKIEGKNVFYWFQNHKARERQKRRRQMDVSLPHEPEIHERKESGSSRTSYEAGQTKNWSPSTNCSTIAEESAPSKQKAAATATASVLSSAECSRPENGWIQFDPDPTTISNTEWNATWQMIQHHHLLINPSEILSQEATAKRTMVDPNYTSKLLKARELMNIFIASSSSSCCLENRGGRGDSVINGAQTLQLFPVQSSINGGESQQILVRDKDSSNGSSVINTTTEGNRSNLSNSFQFYEFLPLKN